MRRRAVVLGGLGLGLGVTTGGLAWLWARPTGYAGGQPPTAPGGFAPPTTAAPATAAAPTGRSWQVPIATHLAVHVDLSHLYLHDADGIVYALDVETGATVWQTDSGLLADSGVLPAGEVLLVGGQRRDRADLERTIVAVDRAGRHLWRLPLPTNSTIARRVGSRPHPDHGRRHHPRRRPAAAGAFADRQAVCGGRRHRTDPVAG